MPSNPAQANVWFYQDFLSSDQKENFWMNRPEDWARLQIWDGTNLKPAMEPGFQGRPTHEQVEMLHQHAQQSQLFFFELGNAAPRQLGNEQKSKKYVSLNLQLPEKPEEPVGVDETSSLMVSYRVRLNEYNYQMEEYQRQLDTLDQLGDGFKNAVNAYNAGRNMERENAEASGRDVNRFFVEKQRNRDKADRVIDEVFGPKPIASLDTFFVFGHPVGEAVFRYDHYDNQFVANGFEPDPDSQLTAKDIATINFAMVGAKEPVAKAYRELHGTSPVKTEGFASEDFNMLVTGMFGESRINQPLADNYVIGHVLKQSKAVIDQYNAGSYEPLGIHLGACVRNIKNTFAGSVNSVFSQDMVAATKLIERIDGLFQKDPRLQQAAGLQDNELEFMRGYVEMGKIYDNHLQSCVALNEAKAHGQTLTTEQKAEFLADAVLHAMVENELAKDRETMEASDEFLQKQQEAAEKDQIEEERYEQWKQDVLDKITDKDQAEEAKEKYIMQHDYNAHMTLAISQPMDHKIISLLAQDGMRERLRQNLMKDPNILAAAAKEPMDISGKALNSSNAMKELAEKTAPVLKTMEVTDVQKQAWFDSMKAMVTAPKEGAINPWLNAAVGSDASRLVIAVPNAQGGKDMVPMADLVEGGLRALENPDRKTLDLLYRNALEGNLYYYEVGEKMPKRVDVNEEQASVEQMKPPVGPTFLQWLINKISFGLFYADVCNPQPDRDPAAMEGILRASDGRTATITVEVAAHNQIANELAQPAAQAAPDQGELNLDTNIQNKGAENEGIENKNDKKPENEADKLTREFLPYSSERVSTSLERLNYSKDKIPENNLGLTGEDAGVLMAMALSSPDLSIKRSKTSRESNNPDVNYEKIVGGHYIQGNYIQPNSRSNGFILKAKDALATALQDAAAGNYNKLGKFIADGLTLNNKMLQKQQQLSDFFTSAAELGNKAMKIMNSNEHLQKAVMEHLGKDTKQLDMAKAAKNISDLRVSTLPTYKTMLEQYDVFVEKEVTQKDGTVKLVKNPVVSGKPIDVAKVFLLSDINIDMQKQEFKLEDHKFADKKAIEQAITDTANTKVVYSLLEDRNRITVLRDPVKMKMLCAAAGEENAKAAGKNQNELIANNQPKNQVDNEVEQIAMK